MDFTVFNPFYFPDFTLLLQEHPGVGKLLLKLLLHLRAFAERRPSPGDDDQIISRLYMVGKLPKRLANDPSGPVSHDGVSDFLTGGDADLGHTQPVFSHVGDRERSHKAFSLGVGAPKFVIFA